MSKLHACAVLAAFLCGLVPARANDSTAQLGAGGIVLAPNAGVTMRKEVLHLSFSEVRIEYEFFNETEAPITTLVAFPLPLLSGFDQNFGSVLPMPEAKENFVGFEVKVDGTSVTSDVEQRALMLGLDVTADLKADGVPINPFVADVEPAFDTLPAERKAWYTTRGMIVPGENGKIEGASWDVKTTFHWSQTFPPGVPVKVEHRYKPVVGQSFFGASSLDDKSEAARYRSEYCLDRAVEASLRKAIQTALKSSPESGGYLTEYRIDYILRTARNWGDSRIADFKLTIEKPKPEAILSLCWKGKLVKAGASTFEFSAKDFEPDQDLAILAIDTAPPR